MQRRIVAIKVPCDAGECIFAVSVTADSFRGDRLVEGQLSLEWGGAEPLSTATSVRLLLPGVVSLARLGRGNSPPLGLWLAWHACK